MIDDFAYFSNPPEEFESTPFQGWICRRRVDIFPLANSFITSDRTDDMTFCNLSIGLSFG